MQPEVLKILLDIRLFNKYLHAYCGLGTVLWSRSGEPDRVLPLRRC